MQIQGTRVAYDLTVEYTSQLDSADPPLVTALDQQLGLKLRPGSAPVDVLVVEYAERLTSN